MRALRRGLALGLALLGGTAVAEPLARGDVPTPLAPWVDWVLRGHEAERCPAFLGEGNRRGCIWPSRLALDLADGQGRFTQEWWVHHESAVPLPGDAKHWPQEVTAGGRPIAVVEHEGRPSARLSAGRHALAGRFRWDALPELLSIPPETGIVSLRLAGREVPFPNRDAKGRLWLRARDEGGPGEQRLELKVHRRVVDEVPLELETRLEIEVAGQSREALLGRALPPGFVPLSLSSPLPARLESDGRLRVQVRPGRWRLQIGARHEGPAETLGLPEPGGPWDESEVWVFEARPHLRQVTVEGGVQVDPSQTTLPGEWRQLPAYLMESGRALRLVEKRRGDAEPAPDQLRLARTWWLDFDGVGYTLTDAIQGTVSRSARLEMRPGTELGRVAIDGRDQVITRLEDAGLAGVEVAQGPISLAVDSRVEGEGLGWLSDRVPAVGWDHDFQTVEAGLHLPPGWRLLHASGVDRAAPTSIERWTLLDLFAVLVLSAVFWRLWGARWGAFALVGLALSWTEPGAPQWAWAFVLAGEALRRVLPEGRFPRFARGLSVAAGAALALLVLIAVPFAVTQIRGALFPALERPAEHFAATVEFARLQRDDADAVEEIQGYGQEAAGAAKSLRRAAPAPASEAPARYRYQPDPNAKVTTGPGLPAWQWRSVSLQWSGPVGREQTLRLWLIPPFASGVLAFARVGLVSALVLLLLGGAWRGARGGLRPAAAALAFLALVPAPARAELPTPELLDELRRRLLEAPACHPRCASSPRLALDVRPAALRARVEVHAQAETAVPLPGGARSWLPERVLVDGRPASALLRSADGTLWVKLDAGRHELVAEGALPERDSIELPLPLRPHRVEARTNGWTLHGVHEDGVPESTLQLARVRARGDGGERALEPGELPPFLQVSRHLSLDLEWRVATRVIRLSPADTALVLEVPLLSGESVTTAGIRASSESALISMPPGVTQVSWTSILSERPQVALRAATELPISEVWHLDAGPVWHVDAEGIPPVHRPPVAGARVREWRPWPGEQVVLRVRRPEGVEGSTATIDATRLALTQGLRATDATLDLTLRASRGGPHPLTLPEGAELQRVSIDGTEQPIRQEGRIVRLPLRPGTQTIQLTWREPRGARQLVFRGSEVDPGMPSVNAELRVNASPARWILWLGGPDLGPAVLFWPLLVVYAALALLLGGHSARTGATPLRIRHWLLLGVGLTQVPAFAAALVVAWLLALGWRRRGGTDVPGRWFDAVQLGLVLLTAAALVVLFAAIRQGLLGLPEMQIAGHGSGYGALRWYQDRVGGTLPQPWVLSVPLAVYRLLMLVWALWLALALVGWLRWAWSCFASGELWRPLRRARSAPAS